MHADGFFLLIRVHPCAGPAGIRVHPCPHPLTGRYVTEFGALDDPGTFLTLRRRCPILNGRRQCSRSLPACRPSVWKVRVRQPESLRRPAVCHRRAFPFPGQGVAATPPGHHSPPQALNHHRQRAMTIWTIIRTIVKASTVVTITSFPAAGCGFPQAGCHPEPADPPTRHATRIEG
jgi:hypothetical protein